MKGFVYDCFRRIVVLNKRIHQAAEARDVLPLEHGFLVVMEGLRRRVTYCEALCHIAPLFARATYLVQQALAHIVNVEHHGQKFKCVGLDLNVVDARTEAHALYAVLCRQKAADGKLIE